MSAPSFSSFPSSFLSFPDLGAEPSKASPNAEPFASSKPEQGKRTKEKGGGKKDDRRRDRHSERDKSHRTTAKRERRARNDTGQTEGQANSSEKPEASSSESTNVFFYSDCKGDPLNLQYGGLHTAHIPKHRLVAGTRLYIADIDI